MEHTAGVSYVRYPNVQVRQTPLSDEELLRRYEEVLAILGEESVAAPLRDTAFWTRIFSNGDLVGELEDLGAGRLLRHLEHCRDRIVPAGVVHGDLARGNLMITTDGEFHLIDWDRWESPSPLFLEAVAVAFRFAQLRAPSDDPAERVKLLLRRDPSVPLLDRVLDVCGQLSFEEAVGFQILNRAGWQRLYHPRDRSFDDRLSAYLIACGDVIAGDRLESPGRA
jgi:hypothetical protein